jgi:acyl dehydratase
MPMPKPYRVVACNIDPTADNKIHDDDVAQQFGFRGALVPGVELFAYLTHPLVEAWGTDFLSHGRIDVRFRRPVYDGETVIAGAEPATDGSWSLALTGADDGEIRSLGSAAIGVDRPPVDQLADAPLPATLPPADEHTLRRGPLGTVSEPVDEATASRYLDAINETLPLYRELGIVHPGGLLRLVNAILVRNVALGPWIHTSSSCHLLAPARLPTTLTGRAAVTDNFRRGAHDYVRYTAVVRADDVAVMQVDHTAIYRIGVE